MIRWGVGKMRWVLLVGVSLCVCLGAGTVARADGIAISMSGQGTALIDLPALVMSGTLTAHVEQTGSVTASPDLAGFAASGECRGTGYRDFVSGTTEVWVAYRTAGKTTSDEAIELRGLLHLLLHSTAPLLTEEILTGTHYVAVTVGGAEQCFLGGFAGSIVQGDLVPPQPGAFAALAGEGFVELSGETVPESLPVSLFVPLDATRWPAPFAEYLAALFDGAL